MNIPLIISEILLVSIIIWIGYDIFRLMRISWRKKRFEKKFKK